MRKKIEDEAQRRVHQVNCALTSLETAVLDERRGAVSRAEFLRLAALDAPPAVVPVVWTATGLE